MKHNKKDLSDFQEQVCKKTCIRNGKCIKDKREDSWFLMCPHYFNWENGINPLVKR